MAVFLCRFIFLLNQSYNNPLRSLWCQHQPRFLRFAPSHSLLRAALNVSRRSIEKRITANVFSVKNSMNLELWKRLVFSSKIWKTAIKKPFLDFAPQILALWVLFAVLKIAESISKEKWMSMNNYWNWDCKYFGLLGTQES